MTRSSPVSIENVCFSLSNRFAESWSMKTTKIVYELLDIAPGSRLI